MDEKLAAEFSDHLVFSTKKLKTLIQGLKESCSEDEYQHYLEKISHIMALNFDLLDLVGNEYPHMHPYKDAGHH